MCASARVPSHYALSLLAAAAGAAFATRQILLHILPGDPGYGTALLGYHYYTWALIGFAAAILLISAMLLFDRQFEPDGSRRQRPALFASLAVWLVIALVALNVVSTLLQCGFGACADDPVVYEMLKRWALRSTAQSAVGQCGIVLARPRGLCTIRTNSVTVQLTAATAILRQTAHCHRAASGAAYRAGQWRAQPDRCALPRRVRLLENAH